MAGQLSSRAKKWIIAIVIAIIVIAVLFGPIVSFITDYWWFKDLGYTQVFFKKLFTELKIGIPSFIVIAVLAALYMRSLKRSYLKRNETSDSGMSDLNIRRITLAASAVISLLLTYIITTSMWKQILYVTHSTDFGTSDPVFNLDISFYVFKLAFLKNALSIAYTVIITFIIMTLVYYAFLMSVRRPQALDEKDVYTAENVSENPFVAYMSGGRQQVTAGGDAMRTLLRVSAKQLTVLAVILFALIACTFFIKQFDLLYTDSGTVFGAGFKDSVITMNLYRIEAVLAVVAAVFTVIFVRKKKYRKLLYLPAIMIAVAIAGGIIGMLVQSLVVSPDELDKEKPYLENNISYTQEAYGLKSVKVKDFNADGTLTGENIKNNQPTISNIRINDFKPSEQFYNQTQAIRTYYTFNDVDVDRYNIDNLYTQTFLSAREMNTDSLGSDVSWLSKHLKYTHGYGLTLSRVDAITESGQPDMIIDNIPPKSDTDSLKISQPAIYFGEMTDNYAITNTKEKEFDYPSGDKNKYTTYKSDHGVKLTPIKRLLYAIKEKNIRILVSSNITSDSKILYDRDIETRVQKIAPFLEFDSDPYITISDSGKLYWIIDAYTTSSYYPYSEVSELENGQRVNYVHNPVKVTVDAYNGTVNFYKVEDEPVAETIAKIYPGLIKDASEMPDGLDKHIRYSNTMFEIQSRIYQRYHMNNVNVFYQNEDKWDVATNVYGQKETELKPNYFIMKLPGESEERFISSVQFTPSGKKNLTGIMVAGCDSDNYGKLTLYKLPKDKVIYGPMQIESQIDQNTDISKEFSLWNSSGSTYTRGDMFVIPIDDSLLYVEPIYLESDTETSLPEVKRVIVAYKDRIAYGSTLADSLKSLFDLGDDYDVDAGTSAGTGSRESSSGKAAAQADNGGAQQQDNQASAGSQSVTKLAQLAAEAYDNAQGALKDGDWQKYGEYQKQLKDYLDQMTSAENAGTSADTSQNASSDNDGTDADESAQNDTSTSSNQEE